MRRPYVLVAVAMLALDGCGEMTPAPPRSNHAAGCASRTLLRPGASFTVRVAGDPRASEGRTRRVYVLHVPVGYVASVRTPLVLYFHGAGSSAERSDAGSGWSQLADRDRFLVVYPQGLPFGGGGPAAWASAGTVDYGIDDLGFVRRLLADVEHRVCVARGAVFATGMSSGGGMASYLACALASKIAAAAPIAANNYVLTKLGCHPTRPIALLEVHGTADQVVPYAGILRQLDPVWPLPSIPAWISSWARRDRCRTPPTQTRAAHDQTVITYRHCAAGEAVILYRLNGAGHTYPARLAGRPTDALIYSFFRAHQRRRDSDES